MSLSWNEVRDRAIRFCRQWTGVTSERSEAKTFWDEFCLYEQLTAPLVSLGQPKRGRKKQPPAGPLRGRDAG